VNRRKTPINAMKAEADSLDDEDLDRLTDTTRALIVTNKEIWERCKPGASVNENWQADFRRLGYFSVHATTPFGNGTVVFRTTFEAQDETFPELPVFPSVLLEIMPGLLPEIPESEDELLPNYEEYLSRAMYLQDDILKPFLTIMKEHLKSVQVFLGEIESWLLEANCAVSFINHQFGMKLSLPDPGANWMHHEHQVHSIVMSGGGEIDKYFPIGTEKGQLSLTKFMEYLSNFG